VKAGEWAKMVADVPDTTWNIFDLGSMATSRGKAGNPPGHWHT